jgi:hypothetical protein
MSVRIENGEYIIEGVPAGMTLAEVCQQCQQIAETQSQK